MKKTVSTRGRGFPDNSFEFAAYTAGFPCVAGVDEAGRGPLAGPVVAAAVIFKNGCAAPAVNDSKKLSAARREELFDEITGCCMAHSIASAEVDEIDEINIYNAALLAMKRAVEGLDVEPSIVFVDGPKSPDLKVPGVAVKGGDGRCFSVAAASILAKVARDRMMAEYEDKYPGYGFVRHKGYGTREHIEALERLGPAPVHRVTFGPVKKLLEGRPQEI